MTPDQLEIVKLLGLLLGFFAVVVGLPVLFGLLIAVFWYRHQVKRELVERGLKPRSIRWLPLAGRRLAGVSKKFQSFSVTWNNDHGRLETARCLANYCEVIWLDDQQTQQVDGDQSIWEPTGVSPIGNRLIALCLAAYAAWGAAHGRFTVPRKIGNALAGRPPIHITGAALWLVVTALLLWAIALLVEAAACQVENSQRRRRRFILAWTFRATAFLAFLLSVVMTKH